MGPARQLDRPSPVGVSLGGFGGAFPQHAGRRLTGRGFGSASRVGQAQLGGCAVAGGGPGGGSGALGAFAGPDQRADGLRADLAGVGVAGHGLKRVQVVPGDDVGDFLAVAREGGVQVDGHLQVAGLAVTPGQRVVGDLAEHLLGEPVAAPLGGQRIGGHAEDLAADQGGQGGPY